IENPLVPPKEYSLRQSPTSVARLARALLSPHARPLSGGSPREGARSELASGAATGGGGPQGPPPRTTARERTLQISPPPRWGAGGGGPQAPPTRTTSRKVTLQIRPLHGWRSVAARLGAVQQIPEVPFQILC